MAKSARAGTGDLSADVCPAGVRVDARIATVWKDAEPIVAVPRRIGPGHADCLAASIRSFADLKAGLGPLRLDPEQHLGNELSVGIEQARLVLPWSE
jgi:hypothetical protein